MNIQLNGSENNMNGGDLGSRKGLSPSFENIISIFTLITPLTLCLYFILEVLNIIF